MDKQTLYAMRKALRKDNKKYSKELVNIPRDQWPFTKPESNRTEVWRSRDYLVQVFAEGNQICRLSICKSDIGKDGHWVDGLSWDELQSIKNAIGFAEQDAVEAYPRERDVVNVANLRHLWVFPIGYPFDFIWRKGAADG